MQTQIHRNSTITLQVKIKGKQGEVSVSANSTYYDDNNNNNNNNNNTLSTIPGKHCIQKLQKNSYTGHGANTSGSTTVKVKKFIMGNSMKCSNNSNHRTGAALYTLVTWVFSAI
jgi:hypothetical protein